MRGYLYFVQKGFPDIFILCAWDIGLRCRSCEICRVCGITDLEHVRDPRTTLAWHVQRLTSEFRGLTPDMGFTIMPRKRWLFPGLVRLQCRKRCGGVLERLLNFQVVHGFVTQAFDDLPNRQVVYGQGVYFATKNLQGI